MDIDLEALSRDELQQLISDAQKALKSVDARRRAEAKRAAEKAAKEFGFSLDEVLDAGPKGSKGAPKYANPADPSQTWTGRGRKPNWVIAALEEGKTLDDLAL
ncbi:MULTISPECIES: H-NS family nucleoid-associated regulatory protein [Mameliella]|uniref:Histone family protein nucleoid-structuring protein H-NS n=1 Tax=Mameliella alba TaxID=561184 RepID=A0A0B3S8D8_9RHOB|nr:MULTISPECIES: H-NS histone family protein [Mameliella]MCR9275285.1 H-NS histone family protein [Paracoccaceae bacterium]ODM48568.1 DNA-binding protein [Ruegeria sp. PBVC088]KHQ55248.1 Histone family protein nucleoid-structuring protein H-NS [Mameliella alba]MBY6118962.1 H-NS histone family protein [Mameliella alba]MDD9732691.1 H-NS histone family protein [Mameliella sp. AT18]